MKIDRGSLDDTLAAMFSNVTFRKSYLFYAHMIGQCSIKIRRELPAPAGVAFIADHYELFINPEQFDKFDLHGRLAILKHEMLHILYGHITTRIGDISPSQYLRWNYATDCALNQQIDSDHLPDCAITPKTLGVMLDKHVPENRSSEEYFNLIHNDDIDNKDNSSDSGEGQGDEQGEGQGSGSDTDQQNSGGLPKVMDSHETWEESYGADELKDDLTKRMIEKAQIETIKGKGSVPGECSEWLELVSQKAEVNWKKVLRGITGNKRVGTRSTIMKKDRRFPKRSDLRGKTKDRMFNLLIVCDVSGSMDNTAILKTLSEVRHVCEMTKTDVDLIQIDVQAYEPEKLTAKTKTFTRKAAGGTNLYPAIEKAKEYKIDYQAVVVLTDGGLFGNDIQLFKELRKKVIWLIDPTGHVDEQMNEGLMQAFKLKG